MGGLHEMGVVTVLWRLKTVPLRRQTAIRVSRWATRWTWTVAAVDCMTIVWMMTAGPWLDKQHNLLSMATWNGHHQVLLVVASCSLVALAVAAPITRGFSEGPPVLLAIVVIADFVSIVAIAGLLALVLPVIMVSFGVGLLARLLR
jgi:hypothetical protein